MSLDVGELVARLTLDDSRFIQGTQRSEQQSRQSTQRISNGFQDITRAAARAGEAAQAVEINRQLDRQAQQAAQRIQELERNAQRADQSVDDIVMNDRLLNEARDAARGIDEIRAGARQAAGALNDIELGNRLREDLQAAQGDLDDLYRQAGDGGAGAGDQAGGNFLSGFTDTIGNLASSTGPIAGSLLGVAVIGLTAGAALAAAIKEGMEQEKTQDLFQARTGVTEGQARKFGLAAGESYADAFGESVEGNLDTAKFALRNGLLDPAATQRDAEKMINSLDGVATIMEEEIPAVAKAAGQALKTGFAVDAQDAFDLFTKATQLGLNNSEDFLDTVNEYGTQFRKLGLTGAESIGLMSQAVKAGARDTDLAADALKEFSIRAIDGSELSAKAFADLAYEQDGVALSQQDLIANNEKMSEGFGALGFNAEDMGKKIAGGGEGAREALGQVLDKLRGVTDEQERATLATALFGTQAEDLGDALYAMDLDTAIQSMNDYEGAAWRAINVMGGNASTSVEGAMRSIELAGDGMKAALAQAFGPYIKDFADNISNNRAGVIQFFIDIGNTVFEAGKSVLGFVEGGLRGLAEFAVSASETGASFLDMGANILSVGEAIPVFGDLLGLATGGAADKMRDMADKTRTGGEGISNMLEGAADGIHDTLIPALGQAQDRFNEFAGDMKLSAAFNDESAKVNKAIADIGVGADGAAIKIENWTGSIDRNNEAQVQMENGLKGMSDQFVNQIKTGMEAGNTVEALTGQYNENRNALIEQLMATGMSNKAAVDYLNVLGLTPEFVDTKILQSGMPEAKYELDVLKDKVIDVPDSKTIHTQALTQDSMDQLKALGLKVETLPDGTVNVTAETADAEARMQEWLSRQRTLRISAVITERRVAAGVDPTFIGPSLADNGLADGAIRTRADGMIDTAHIQQGSGQGIYTKSPLGPVQYAEGETQWEAYIPGAPSKRKRSEAILQDVARRFGFGLIKPDAIKMANGGVVESFTGIASQHAPGLQLTSSYRDTNDYHGQGKAVDYSNGSGNTDEQLAWANYLADNYQSQLAELIYSDPRFTRNIKDGKIVDPSFYGAATMQQHENHVHAASKEPLGAPSGAGKDAAPAAPDTRTEREKIADQVIAEGKRRGISDKGIKAAVMTALAETDLQNLDYGMDGDNAGIMQQRDNGGWGTLEDRKDPTRLRACFTTSSTTSTTTACRRLSGAEGCSSRALRMVRIMR